MIVLGNAVQQSAGKESNMTDKALTELAKKCVAFEMTIFALIREVDIAFRRHGIHANPRVLW